MHQENQNFPELYLNSQETGNKEYKRCFKICIKDFKNKYLEVEEEKYNCLNKYFEAGNFCSKLMMRNLNQLIMQDPKLKIAFQKPQ